MRPPDRIDIARRALGQAFTHPYTWLPFTPIAGAYAFMGVPWWLCLPAAVLVSSGVGAAWMKRWSTMVERVRTEVMLDFRRAENEDLARRIAWLATTLGTSSYVGGLQEALEIKRTIEMRVFGDGLLTDEEEEVNRMAAELVRSMIEEMERLHAQGASQLTSTASDRFEKAAQTLRQANSELETILNPVPTALCTSPSEDDALSLASQRLSERIEQAQGIRRILERTAITPPRVSEPKSRALSEG